MTDWTAGSRVKVERAKEHVMQLEAAVEAFFKGSPYEAVGEQDPEPGWIAFRAKIQADPPPRMGAIIGDVVHNLRSALDVLVCQLYETATGKIAPRHLDFPIYDTREQFEARRLREIERASQDAVEIIKALKPYKLGNPPLWILQQLNNRDKHHVLTPVGSGLRNITTDFLSALIGPISNMFPPDVREEFQKIALPRPVNYLPGRKQAFCPLKHDAVLLRAPATIAAYIHEHTQFTFETAFAEGELVHAEPIMPIVHQLTDLVEGILNAFAMLPIRPRPRGGQGPSAET